MYLNIIKPPWNKTFWVVLEHDTSDVALHQAERLRDTCRLIDADGDGKAVVEVGTDGYWSF